MKNWLAKPIYALGMRLRNPKIERHLKFLLTSQHWSLDRLHQHQLSTLRALVSRAYQYSPYFHQRMTQVGCKPEAIQELADISKLPILEKQELLSHSSRMQIANGITRQFYSETSGSTGTPLVFYRDDDWDAWHNAAVMRGYQWYGVKPWDPSGYLWGFDFAPPKRVKTRALDLLQNRFRMFSYDDQEIVKFARKLRKATYLGGYSSMIYEIAKAVNRIPSLEPLSNLKLVKGTSEKIFDNYQVEAQKAFGRKIVSEYGSAEAGIIAFECPYGAMHVTSETCIVEVQDGEILVTNLVSNSLPIIRYRLGDHIDYAGDMNCPCGMKHPVIREVTGRVGKLIKGMAGSYPSLTLYYVFKNLAQKGILLNYAASQDQIGKMCLRIEQSLNDQSRDALNSELTKYFGRDLEIDTVDNSELRSKDRKFRDFVSSLQ